MNNNLGIDTASFAFYILNIVLLAFLIILSIVLIIFLIKLIKNGGSSKKRIEALEQELKNLENKK